MVINSRIVQKNFSKNSQKYDQNASMQKEAAKKLCDFAKKYLDKNSKILDLGSGTSFVAKSLLKHTKKYQVFETDISLNMLKNWQEKPDNIFSFSSDIDNLPIKEIPLFDAVFASFSLQWINDFDKLILQIKKICKPNAIVAFCLPTQKTLEEIRISSDKSGCNFYLREFLHLNSITLNLENSGFKQEILESEIILQKHKNSVACLKNIKIIGANYFDKKNHINKKKLEDFNDFFFKNYDNTCSWHISYMIYKKL